MFDRSKFRNEAARAAELLNRVQRRADSGAPFSPGDLRALEEARLTMLGLMEHLRFSAEEEEILSGMLAKENSREVIH